MKNIVEGTLTGNARGYAFFTPDNNLKNVDYFISHGDLRGAMHGDKVLCEISEYDNKVGKRTTARVLKVISRGVSRIVGTYFTSGRGGFVSPDDNRYFSDVFVPFGKGLRARAGDKVVVKILSYPQRKSPEGIITKVLGRQFEKKAELESILYAFNLPDKFPTKVINEVEGLSPISEKDYKGRLDLRNKKIFTIDGEDAKDFDDAVSVEKDKDGNYILGVHIADVTNYVKYGGETDKEAFYRGTSVYFPEKVIPMLPERLCNDLCSLIEGKDRLTLSCIMTINSAGDIINYEITPSVIKSVKRATYTAVEKLLSGDEKIKEEYADISKDIFVMEELSEILLKRSEENGAIDLDVKDSEISVDKKGRISVGTLSSEKARKIIETFMISANRCVAEYLFYAEEPCLYRVHEKPSDEKVDRFYAFIKALGITAKRNKTVYPKDFADILKKAENTPAFTVINRVMLRSMQKAKYSPTDIGHFGLSEKHYCHFTSPIRRYPDLTVHRILKDFIAGKDNLEGKYRDFVIKAAEKSSERERNAQEAERAVDDYYKMLYIGDYVGEEFDAIISGVTNFGLFAELDNGIEGLIKIETIKWRRYNFNEEAFTLTDGKKSYRLGQEVKIKVSGVNLSERKAEFVLID